MSNKEAILAKIQKCLNLSKSASANEAATAMRQAQKLMEMHQITPEEMDLVGYGISDPVNITTQPGKNMPKWARELGRIIGQTFGVQVTYHARYTGSGYKHTITYAGPKHRLQVAEYVHSVMTREMTKGWNEYNNGLFTGERNSRTAFFIGWLGIVEKKVSKFRVNDEEQKRTDLVLKTRFGELEEAGKLREGSLDADAYYAGRDAARGFDVHTPMNAGEKLKELK